MQRLIQNLFSFHKAQKELLLLEKLQVTIVVDELQKKNKFTLHRRCQ